MARIYETSSGLNTIVRPFAVPYQGGKDVFLRRCGNVDINDVGKISRRNGTGQIMAQSLGACHSQYDDGDLMYFVEGDALSTRDANGTVARLRTVTENLRMSFTTVARTVFHTNGVEQGRVTKDGVARTWVSPPGGPTGPNISVQWSDPPLGHLLGAFGPHVLVAAGNFIYPSREFDPYHFNPSELRIPCGSPAVMMRQVAAGMWVSNQNEIYFYQGTSVTQLRPVKKHDAPAVMGTDLYVDQNEVVAELPEDRGVMVTARDGILLLTHDGQVIPRSKRKITIPAGFSGAAMARNGQYHVNINF